MPVFFAVDTWKNLQTEFKCLYCEHVFKQRGELNVHYLSEHEEAFSEEELMLARGERARIEQRLKR